MPSSTLDFRVQNDYYFDDNFVKHFYKLNGDVIYNGYEKPQELCRYKAV